MDNITENIKSIPKEPMGFFKYVFNFDEENKCQLLNMFQYTILAIIPVMITLKGIKYIIPEEDESKGSLEILAESVGQIILIILAIWFTHKIINYIPTYSECEYPKFNSTNFIIPLLIILTTMQTKFGAKLNILLERVIDLWNGEKSVKTPTIQENKQNTPSLKQNLPTHQPSQADYRDLSQILPSSPQMASMPSQQPISTNVALQSTPDFNSMYQGPDTPLVNAKTPGITEPMAANEGFSAFGGSPW